MYLCISSRATWGDGLDLVEADGNENVRRWSYPNAIYRFFRLPFVLQTYATCQVRVALQDRSYHTWLKKLLMELLGLLVGVS